jgi:transposase-like protein
VARIPVLLLISLLGGGVMKWKPYCPRCGVENRDKHSMAKILVFDSKELKVWKLRCNDCAQSFYYRRERGGVYECTIERR